MGLKSLKSLKGLKGLKGLKSLEGLKGSIACGVKGSRVQLLRVQLPAARPAAFNASRSRV